MTGKNKPSVLQLIDGLNMGGAEVLLRELVAGLKSAGYSVSVGYSTPGPIEEMLKKMEVPLTRLPRLMRVDPFLLWKMISLIRHVKPDIVHTHLFKSDFHGRLAAWICGVPVIVSTAHNSDAWAKNYIFGFLFGLTNYFVDKVIAVSDEVREYQIKYTHISREKICTINNGVDVQKFAKQSLSDGRIRVEFGIAESMPVVGIIGRLGLQKDHSNFLMAAAWVKELVPSVKFLIVGDGPLHKKLELQSRSLDLESSVIFCGIRQDIPDLLEALDVLVISSLWEGLPVTLLEGMAAGLPIVATAVDGIVGVVENEKTALLVPPADPKALAGACVRIIKDPLLGKALGEAALSQVMEKYTLTDMIKKIIGLYDELS